MRKQLAICGLPVYIDHQMPPDTIRLLASGAVVGVITGLEVESMTKTETLYVCPHCGRESTDPKVRAITAKRPDAETEYHCPCGNVYTQATARKVTFKDRT